MAKTTKANAPAVLGSGRNFTSAEAMGILGYSDTTSFLQAAKRAGIPYVRVSARRIIFRERDLEAWMDARTVGAPIRGRAA